MKTSLHINFDAFAVGTLFECIRLAPNALMFSDMVKLLAIMRLHGMG